MPLIPSSNKLMVIDLSLFSRSCMKIEALKNGEKEKKRENWNVNMKLHFFHYLYNSGWAISSSYSIYWTRFSSDFNLPFTLRSDSHSAGLRIATKDLTLRYFLVQIVCLFWFNCEIGKRSMCERQNFPVCKQIRKSKNGLMKTEALLMKWSTNHDLL